MRCILVQPARAQELAALLVPCQVLFLIPVHTAPLQGGTAILEVMGYLQEGPSFRLLFSISSFPVQIENVLL